ncbi:asparagine synthase (glutamine-hydrolyzing) [Psychroserpens mesophilus]|uniref:asparagine synthase (glutamine-hydrolyzing) n=1 Tax=Psychroserpens mesophilus TaxID=325473 RepID=UPI003D65AFEA
MCGIYGEFFKKSKLSPKSAFLKQNDLNSSRGPDMSGYWTNDTDCQLGFRRLSILDLSERGNQPMLSYDEKHVIVFNGEIYNFQELKTDLLKKNIPFHTETDSEVLVNTIAYYGLTDTLNKLDGMYAFAVYDITKKQVDLVRDFAGIKPLFYSFDDGDLVFGSRYDQVSKHDLNKNNGIDNAVLRLYLKRHYMPAPYGIINKTFQLRPGEIVSFLSDGSVHKRLYWELPDLNDTTLITSENTAINHIEKELTASVHAQMVSDVQLGTFLSGGIDSPLITYLAKQKDEDIQSYSIGSDSSKHDESEIATAYAKKIGCKFRLDKMNATSAMDVLEDSMEHLKEPFADFSLIPTYLLCHNAKKMGTVMLSGDGGDELFFGYQRFESVSKNKKWFKLPKSLRYLAYGLDKILFHKKHINEVLLQEDLAQAHQGLHSRFSDEHLNALFPNLKSIPNINLPYYNYKNELSDKELLHAMRKAEYYDMMQKTLIKVDRMSMANAMEVRVPFLKKSMIEAALKIDPELAFKNNEKKLVLKRLLGKLIPGTPISHVKKGFSIPLTAWLRKDLKEPVKQCLFDKNFIDTFQLSETELNRIWNMHQTGKRDCKWELFTLYSLAKWHQQQIE